MDEYLQQIKDFQGAEELYSLLERWNRLAERIGKCVEDLGPVFPDMLWITPPASGKTHLLHLLAEHLAVSGEFVFLNQKKYLEFYPEYCPSDGSKPFEVIKRLEREIEKAKGFRPSFRGVIHVDLDEWMGHANENYFHTLLEYLSDHRDEWLIVLTAPDGDPVNLNQMKAAVCAYLRVEIIQIRYPKNEEMVGMISEMAGSHGLTLDDSAKALLLETVEKLRSNANFDGRKTIRMLAEDIVYQCLSEPDEPSRVITEKELAVFSKDSDYVNRMIKRTHHVKMGF